MLKFSALIPDAVVNYITNPSLRYDTTGWNAQGSTITRSLEQARFGIASLKVATNGSATREGAFFRVSVLAGISENITVSAYVRGTGKVRIRLDNNVVGGTEYSSQKIDLDSNRWQRIYITGFSTGGNDMRLYVETDEVTPTARTFYVDGAQMERKPYLTTYCDGDQPGCRWNGMYHGSLSERNAYTRLGGRWIQLAGEEREAEDLYMTVVTGLGHAPISNVAQGYALAPGSYFQNTKVNARSINLTFYAKHLVEDQDQPVSLSHLHQLRQLMIDVVKPDRTAGDEDIWFEYDDGNTPLYFQARYDGGLEGEWDIRNQFVNSFPLSLLATFPFLLEDSQEAQVLDFQESFVGSFVVGRISESWNRLNYGINDATFKMAVGKKGEVYAFSDNNLTVANNNAAAVDPLRPVRGITYWDGEKWNALGPVVNLGGSGSIQDLAVAPNGDLYATGNFTSIGGVAAAGVAKWDGSTWSALGTGINALGQCIAVAPNGDVYVGGQFTTAGGIAAVRIARWDGLAWRRVGQYGGLNGTVWSIAISQDGRRLYAGGDFTDENGNPGSGVTRVAQYNIATGLFSTMGSGFDGTVRILVISPVSGVVFAGGTFLNSGSSSVSLVAEWNGTTWQAMGAGLTSTGSIDVVTDMDFFRDGTLVAVGNFTHSGLQSVRSVGVWNGSTWLNLDVQIQFVALNTDFVNTVAINRTNDDIFMAYELVSGTQHILSSGLNTITNPGTTESKPVIYVLGPGILRWIGNRTTGKGINLDMTILSGEEVFFDFARGEIYSTVRGSLFYAMLEGADFRSFALAPGENILECFMVNDVNASMQITFVPSHWSADATQQGDSV